MGEVRHVIQCHFTKAQGFDHLRKATGISFLEFDLFKDDPQVHSVYRFRNARSARELTDLMELHFVELSKFNDKMPWNQMGRFEKWLYLFRKMPIFVSGGEPIPPEIAAEEDLAMAIAQVKKVNSDTRMRYIIEAQERWDHDVATRLSEARKESREEGIGIGIEKGIGIGVEKGRLEEHEKRVLEKMRTVKNMMAKGLSLEQNADMTGWPLA